MAGIDNQLAVDLTRRIEGCRGLLSCARLSAGASQETYRIVFRTDAGERKLTVRRAPGATAPRQGSYPGLATEAMLIRRLRDNSIALDHLGLADYLREAVVNQVAIDQPTYSGLKTALAIAQIRTCREGR